MAPRLACSSGRLSCNDVPLCRARPPTLSLRLAFAPRPHSTHVALNAHSLWCSRRAFALSRIGVMTCSPGTFLLIFFWRMSLRSERARVTSPFPQSLDLWKAAHRQDLCRLAPEAEFCRIYLLSFSLCGICNARGAALPPFDNSTAKLCDFICRSTLIAAIHAS